MDSSLSVPGPPPEPILPAVPEERAGPLCNSYLQLPQLPEGQRKGAMYPLNSHFVLVETKTRTLSIERCYTSNQCRMSNIILFSASVWFTLFFKFLSTLLIHQLLHDLLLFPLLRFFSTLLQGLLSMERIPVIIRFLPVLFNQLFKVLTQNDNDEVTTATTR